MFLPMDQVKVLESSAVGKYSPRKNSEGFISCNVVSARFLPLKISNSILSPDIKLMLFPYSVVWYKYGNEQRFRKEIRRFVVVLPTPTGNSNLSKSFKPEDFLKLLPTIVKNKTIRTFVMNNYGPHATFGFLKPVRKPGLLSDNLFFAYMYALRRSSNVGQVLFKTKITSNKNIIIVRKILTLNKKSFNDFLYQSNKEIKNNNEENILSCVRPFIASTYNTLLHSDNFRNFTAPKVLEHAVLFTMQPKKVAKKRREIIEGSSIISHSDKKRCIKVLNFIEKLNSHI